MPTHGDFTKDLIKHTMLSLRLDMFTMAARSPNADPLTHDACVRIKAYFTELVQIIRPLASEADEPGCNSRSVHLRVQELGRRFGNYNDTDEHHTRPQLAENFRKFVKAQLSKSLRKRTDAWRHTIVDPDVAAKIHNASLSLVLAPELSPIPLPQFRSFVEDCTRLFPLTKPVPARFTRLARKRRHAA